MSKFSVAVKTLRKQHDMSQKELADKVGVSRSAVSMWEIEGREPALETLEAIADTFNVDMNYLTGRTKKAPAKAEAGDDVIIRFFRSLPLDQQRGILLATGAPEEVLAALDQQAPNE